MLRLLYLRFLTPGTLIYESLVTIDTTFSVLVQKILVKCSSFLFCEIYGDLLVHKVANLFFPFFGWLRYPGWRKIRIRDPDS